MTNSKIISDAKIAVYAIDFSATASVSSLKYWLNRLCKLGLEFGYFSDPTKSWLIVEFDCFYKATNIFNDTNVHIPTQAKRHYGVALSTSQFS